MQGEGLCQEGGDDQTQQVAPEDGRGTEVRIQTGHSYGRLQRPVHRHGKNNSIFIHRGQHCVQIVCHDFKWPVEIIKKEKISKCKCLFIR